MKNKGILRILSCIMLVAMIVTMVASCSKEELSDETTENTVGTIEESGDSTKNDNLELPEGLDFGGKTFTIYSEVQNVAIGEFYQESTTGSVIDDSVYARNKQVEDLLNCKIANEDEPSHNTNASKMTQRMETMVSSGLSDFQIAVTAGFQMCPSAYNGYLTDLASLPDIHREKDYYSQGYNEAMSIGDSQYLITGQMSLSYYRYMMGILFNKNMFSSYKVDEPYQTVIDGDWTLEEMTRLAKLFYVDNNGDGEKDADDTYGFYTLAGMSSSFTDGFMSSCDLRVLSKDENNYYKLDINQGDYSNAIDSILALLYSSGSYSIDGGDYNVLYSAFSNKKAAMITTRMYAVELKEVIDLGNSDGYGVLPLPKANKDQENYISYVQDQCFMFGIPVVYSGNSLTEISQFFEAYSWASYHTVKPVYYEKMLTSRYVHDGNSIEMLEIMDTNVYVDPVNIYQYNGFGAFNTVSLRAIYGSGQNTISSMLASNITRGRLQTQIDKMNTLYKDLADARAS